MSVGEGIVCGVCVLWGEGCVCGEGVLWWEGSVFSVGGRGVCLVWGEGCVCGGVCGCRGRCLLCVRGCLVCGERGVCHVCVCVWGVSGPSGSTPTLPSHSKTWVIKFPLQHNPALSPSHSRCVRHHSTACHIRDTTNNKYTHTHTHCGLVTHRHTPTVS